MFVDARARAYGEPVELTEQQLFRVLDWLGWELEPEPDFDADFDALLN